MDKTQLIALCTSIKTEALACVPIVAGLQSTVLTLQSAISQLEDQISSQPGGAYDSDVDNALQAMLQAFTLLSGKIRQQPAPTVTAPGTPGPLPPLPVLTQPV